MNIRKRNLRRAEGNENTRRWRLPRIPWKRLHWGAILWSIVGLAIISVAAMTVGSLLDRPITRITVTGALQRVSPLDVEKAVRPHLIGVGLVSANLDEIARSASRVPWVRGASVKRSWPPGLTVEIEEQRAVGRWNEAGLVNADGALFVSETRFLPPELPRLTGPVGAERQVVARYEAMQDRLTEAGLRLVTLSLDARGDWLFLLDNGVEVRLGRERVDERFDRFIAVASRLVRARATDIAHVDMRYGTGFAVGWKGNGPHGASDPGGEHARRGDAVDENGGERPAAATGRAGVGNKLDG